MKEPTRERLIEILKEHSNNDRGILGVTYGYKTVNGEVTGTRSIIVRVEKKYHKQQLEFQNGAGKIPEEIDGIPTDIQEGGINPRNSSINPRAGVIIKNEKTSWYGSAGPVIINKAGQIGQTRILLTNYHVVPQIGSIVSFQEKPIGTVLEPFKDKQLDITAILLNPYGYKTFKTFGTIGYGYDNPYLDQTVWFDGGYGTPCIGRVIEIGMMAVNDPVLGRFLSESFSIIPIDDSKTAIPGDSGTSAWGIGKDGALKCVGIVNGSMWKRSTAVPMATALKKMESSGYEWDRILDHPMNLTGQISDKENENSILRRKVQSMESAFSDISNRLSNLDPNTRNYFKISQKDTI